MLDVARSRGLPPFLADDPGVDSGHMIAQYTQAALVSELKRLAVPASVDSIPSSAMQEDHVSMGWSAARKLRRSVDALTRVLAIELLTAARALDLRAPLRPGPATGAVVAALRTEVAGPGHRPVPRAGDRGGGASSSAPARPSPRPSRRSPPRWAERSHRAECGSGGPDDRIGIRDAPRRHRIRSSTLGSSTRSTGSHSTSPSVSASSHRSSSWSAPAPGSPSPRSVAS